MKITKVEVTISYPLFGYLRPILELAGKQVHEIRDGYTERPYPVAKINFSKEDLILFTSTLERYWIAKPFIEQEKLNLIFSHRIAMTNPFPIYKPNLNKCTYIEFDYSGNMSVHIAKKDYEKYKEELTFDQLCQSLGQLILQFFDLYKQGKEDEILKMLKEVK